MELKKKRSARRARSKELRMQSMKTLSNEANDLRLYPVSHDQNFFKQQITEEKQL